MRTDRYYAFMNRWKDELVGEEIHRLRERHAPHYQGMDINLLQLRAIRFVEVFVASFQSGPSHFVRFIHSIAQERFAEGFDLEEIQAAMNILGEKAWGIVVQFAPQRDRVGLLSRVSGTIGAAKDQLARIYLNKLKSAESRLAQLAHCSDTLNAGTISAPEMDEEDLPHRP